MFRRGVTINLGDFQTERVEVAFPFDSLRPNQTFDDAVRWVDTRLRAEIDKVIQREAARGNYINPPLVGEPGPARPVDTSPTFPTNPPSL